MYKLDHNKKIFPKNNFKIDSVKLLKDYFSKLKNNFFLKLKQFSKNQTQHSTIFNRYITCINI